MRIDAFQTQVQHVKVDIDPAEIAQKIGAEILKLHNIPVNAFVLNGQIVVETTHHTSHSWTEQRVVAAFPTPDQLKLLETVELFVQEAKKVQA